MANVPQKVLDLVDTFQRNLDDYLHGDFKEANLRQQFVNPLFKALGWDMDNEQGYAEAYKDVIHEASLKIGGETKAPDYCFRIGGTPKFYLEAKKPSVNIKDDPAPAFQLRRYGWSKKLPLSILTDFEEFAVYDCRVQPAKSDKASTARILYLRFTDYAKEWDRIADVFSREAILKGSFDKYAVANKAKRGTATVDDAFLLEIETWREHLAKNLALRNPELSVRELNFAVQITIDRVIFLRMCEDRGVEQYGQLRGLLAHADIYPELCKLYEKADQRYNSGLFHFSQEKDRAEAPDTLTPGLNIDDKVLKLIFKGLYYPDSPYEFSVLPADILGQVYEQFLGKVIRLTDGHQAKVEEKPEVKKAGGVYYTPTYIVDYIVQSTVGKLLEKKTPKQALKLAILDPACGSGSFLLGAYDYLLKWYLEKYVQEGPAKSKKEVFKAANGEWRLTAAARKNILVSNLYGVDIDPQAVEVTKLSLLLKVLEGESQDSLERQLLLFHGERALPDLASNIKCGNSLIGPDFYEGQQPELFDDEEKYRVNVFDWNAAFPAILKAGGFDAVIGNPPYVRQESLSDFKDYFGMQYESSDGMADLYAYFMEKGVKLLRPGGFFSIIVSSSFLRATYGEPLRRVLKANTAVHRIVDFGGLAVFENAKDTYVCIPLLAKGAKQDRVEVSKVNSLQIRDLSDHVASNMYKIPEDRLSTEAWSLKSDDEAAVFAKVMTKGKPLGDFVERKFFSGVKTGLNEAFEVTEAERAKLVKSNPASMALIKPFLGGQDIRRYSVRDEDRYLIVIPTGWTRQQMAKAKKLPISVSESEAWSWLHDAHASIAKHLAPFTDALRRRQDQGEYWWELRSCDYYHYFDAPKIVFPDICKGPRFFLDRSGIYISNTAYCLGTDDPYLLGFLNSRLFWFAISNLSIPFGIRAGQYRYRLIYQYMEKVPIRVIDPAKDRDKSRRDRISQHVAQMLALSKKLAAAKTPHERTVLEGQVASTDRQIDRLVYELYGLTDAEIAIVEEATT